MKTTLPTEGMSRAGRNALATVLAGCMLVSLTGCLKKSGGSSAAPTPTPTAGTNSATGSGSVRVSWTANRESTVNKSGGGYKVYYSQTSGFAIAAGTMVDVPYVSGSAAPTTTTLSGLASGTWYVRVAAYSSLGTSSASSQTSVQVP